MSNKHLRFYDKWAKMTHKELDYKLFEETIVNITNHIEKTIRDFEKFESIRPYLRSYQDEKEIDITWEVRILALTEDEIIFEYFYCDEEIKRISSNKYYKFRIECNKKETIYWDTDFFTYFWWIISELTPNLARNIVLQYEKLSTFIDKEYNKLS